MALKPIRRTLDNGVTLIVLESRTTPAVSLVGGVRGGSYLDPGDADGTAALVSRVLDRGTTYRSAAAIADDLDARGASLTTTAGRHLITVNATCLANDFTTVAGILAGVVADPAFAQPEVEIRRAELMTSLRQEDDDPASRAVDALMEALYPNHPYGRRGRGRAGSVEQLTRDDLAGFHQTWFAPETLTLVVVGDVDAAEAFATVSAELGSWAHTRAAEIPVPDIDPPRARSMHVVPMMDKAQTDIAYGFTGLRRSDPDYLAAWIMNNALGQYGLGGRLGDSIRERQGMAYYVFSRLEAGLGPGPLMVRAGVSPANVERTVASVDAEIDAVRRHGLSGTEIAESKQYLTYSIPRQLETNDAIAAFLLTADIFGLGMDYDVRLPGLIASVTEDDVNAAARRLLDPSRATIAVAGPWNGTPA